MTTPERLPLADPLYFFMAGRRPVVMENPSYSTLVLFESPARAQQWRAACVDDTPEDMELEGGIIETAEGMEGLFERLPEKVRYVIVNPPPRRDTTLPGSVRLSEFLDRAREAARRHSG